MSISQSSKKETPDEGLGLNRLAQRGADAARGAVPRVDPVKIAAQVVQNVCELPDYNSPDDQPDLVMCTVQELENCVLRAFEALSDDSTSPDETSGCNCAAILDAEAARQRKVWEDYRASGQKGPATSYHTLVERLADMIRKPSSEKATALPEGWPPPQSGPDCMGTD